MKVKQLIKFLEKQDPNKTVILAADGEGNGFGEVDEVTDAMWSEEDQAIDEVGSDFLNDSYKHVVIIWPQS